MNICGLIGLISTFSPKPTFLSDIAAFEAVLIALSIPLSFEIVSRISERYGSEIIAQRFRDERSVKWLPRLLALNISLAIGLRFFVHDNPGTLMWKILAWIIMVIFLFVAALFWLGFLRTLGRYTTDIESVVDTLFGDAEKALK